MEANKQKQTDDKQTGSESEPPVEVIEKHHGDSLESLSSLKEDERLSMLALLVRLNLQVDPLKSNRRRRFISFS